jgi:hypothetical protein
MNAYPRFIVALSVLFFWVLPISPLVSIAALKATQGAQRTPRRRLAVSGAVLCAGFTLFVAATAAREAIRLGGFD